MTDTATQPAVDRETGALAVAGADPEELRYAPRAPRRFLWVRRIAVLVVVLGLLGFVANAAYRWTQSQYYVADSGESVAIYRGIHADVPLVPMSSLFEQSNLTLSALPTFWRSRVIAGIDATDLANAHNIVRELHDAARACADTESPSPSPTPGDGQSTPPRSQKPRAGNTRPQASTPAQRARQRDRQRDQQAGQRANRKPSARPSAGSSPSPSATASPSGQPTPGGPGCAGATS